MSGRPPGTAPPLRVKADRRVLAVAAALLALVVLAVAYVTWDRDPGAAATATFREYPAGDRPAAPPIAGETLDGDRLDLADLRGDVVVVNVWASWCPPCRAETADFEAVHQATRQLGVSFVGVNTQDTRDKARAFVAGRVTYPSLFDPAGEYARGFTDPPPPVGLPATFVIDRDGRLAAAFYRPVGRAELTQLVERLAGEAPAGGPVDG